MMYLYNLIHAENGVHDIYDEVADALKDFNELAGENYTIDDIMPSIRTKGYFKFNDEYEIERIIA